METLLSDLSRYKRQKKVHTINKLFKEAEEPGAAFYRTQLTTKAFNLFELDVIQGSPRRSLNRTFPRAQERRSN